MTTQGFMISVDDLLRVAEATTKKLTVLVPSTDFYRQRGDHEEEWITYIDAESFVTALKELK